MKKLLALLAFIVLPSAAWSQAEDYTSRNYSYGQPAPGYGPPTPAYSEPAVAPVYDQPDLIAPQVAPPALEDYSENPIYPKGSIVDPGCPCFNGRWELGFFAAGLFPESDHSNVTNYDDAVGGGLSIGYWFNENVGLEYSGTWYGTDPEIHNSVIDLVLRWPNRYSCLAPYVFGGGGIHADSENVAIARIGGGLDIRFESWSCIGLFIDGSYNWVDDHVQNYAIGRVGIRIPF
ncbi:MAG: hypothetical protein AAGH89_07715 [Verrucomicrobiota bacterium]